MSLSILPLCATPRSEVGAMVSVEVAWTLAAGTSARSWGESDTPENKSTMSCLPWYNSLQHSCQNSTIVCLA